MPTTFSDGLAIPTSVAHHLGYYVYLYIDPRDDRIFYVGKGKGIRALDHLSEEGESQKNVTLKELEAAGLQPRIDVLAHSLPNEETALRIEAAIIDLYGLGQLTNRIRGWRSIQLGRLPLAELVHLYAAKPVEIKVPGLLFRISKLYRRNMTADEVYETTRGVWKLSGPRREKAKFAFTVFEGVVLAVYEIQAWHPACTTTYSFRKIAEEKCKGRSEFVGRPADLAVSEQYVGGSVAKYFKQGSRGPQYVNCE